MIENWRYVVVSLMSDDHWSATGDSELAEAISGRNLSEAELLNACGAQGWELVNVVATDKGQSFYFKQPPVREAIAGVAPGTLDAE